LATGASCGDCHSGYTATTVHPANHMNGMVDVAGLACSSCHGDSTRADTALNPQFSAAPPKGSKAETATSSRAVGAHALHLKDGNFLACTECHVLPNSTSHSNGTAEIAFGPLARTGGASPSWNGTTCSNVYCPGSFTGGNGSYAPAWTAPVTASCGTCHGLPPVAPHPQNADCSACHTGYTATWINPSLHLNGKLDVSALGCTACHGDSARTATTINPNLPAAPPKDTGGNSATAARGVGAHQRHLVAGPLTAGVACNEWHAVPTSTSHSNGTVDVQFGALSKTGAVSPIWNGSGCSASYCHGNFRNGNTTYVPTWTVVAANKCGTCHGTTANPAPGGTHPGVAATSCGTCHTGYTGTTVNLTNHMNGTVEVTSNHPAGWNAGNQHGYQANLTGLAGCKGCHGTDLAGGTSGVSCTACHTTNGFATWATNCTFCHGNRTTGRQSPPVDIQGRSVATNVSVGRHDKHVASTLMTPIACTECHVARTTSVITDTAHVDGNGIAEVTFGTIAKTGGKTPVYARTSATASGCSATYCHGNFTGGSDASGTRAALSWVSATAMTCTSCHGAPPSTGKHQTHQQGKATNCQHCHSGIATGTGYPSANAALVPAGVTLHVNGAKNLAFGGTYSGKAVTMTVTRSGTRITCTGSCHGSKTW